MAISQFQLSHSMQPAEQSFISKVSFCFQVPSQILADPICVKRQLWILLHRLWRQFWGKNSVCAMVE